VLPTGGGKTAVFSFIAESVRARGKRAIILAHRQELLSQASKSLTRLDVSHGMISPRYSAQPSEPIQVASIQTIVRRLDQVEEPDLLIFDEAHHCTSKSYRKVIARFPAAKILGVTATPCRSDGAGLGVHANGIFDELVLGPSIGELIEQMFLVKPIVYAPPVGIDLSGVRRKMGDYDRAELSNRIDRPKITGDTIAHYLKYCPREPAVAFCVSVRHAEHVANEFRSAGIRAVRVDGGMHDSDRSAALKGLEDGSIDVVTSADLIGEGVDLPRVSAAILLRPTHSLALHLQQVGRALRPYPGKTRALILDHVGNCMRHGLPDDDRDWSLDGSSQKSGKPKDFPIVRIEQCEKCYFVYETGPNNCPKCGHAQLPKLRKIEIQAGELEELKREQAEQRRIERQEQGKARSLEDLQNLARKTGKSPGWAWHVWQSRKVRKRA